jgi:hypothetical protein
MGAYDDVSAFLGRVEDPKKRRMNRRERFSTAQIAKPASGTQKCLKATWRIWPKYGAVRGNEHPGVKYHNPDIPKP